MSLRVTFLALTLIMGACSSKPLAEKGIGHIMYIGGSGYVISQLTNSTWTARAASKEPLATSRVASRKDLLDAIEQVSGCKVTTSNYSGQNIQLDAQLDCSHQTIH